MTTLSELLATFPDPPKTLLNTNRQSTAILSRAASGMFGNLVGSHMHMSHNNLSNSTQSLPVAPTVPGSVDMGFGLGVTKAPVTTTAIAAGGGSAGSTGYQDADIALLERSTREELDNPTQAQVLQKLFSEPVLVVERALDLAYTNARNTLLKDLATAKKKKIEKLEKDSPCSSAVFTNKHFLDFGNHLTVGQEVTDTLDLTNNTPTKIKYRVVIPQQSCALESNSYALTFSPHEGVIKKKDVAHIQFKLQAKQPCMVTLIVLLAVEGGLKYHIIVKQEIFAQ